VVLNCSCLTKHLYLNWQTLQGIENGEHYEFVEHANGQLVAVSPDGKKVKSSPAELGCYLLSKNRTDRGLAKDRLRSFWED
jgi:hypothetical protein